MSTFNIPIFIVTLFDFHFDNSFFISYLSFKKLIILDNFSTYFMISLQNIEIELHYYMPLCQDYSNLILKNVFIIDS